MNKCFHGSHELVWLAGSLASEGQTPSIGVFPVDHSWSCTSGINGFNSHKTFIKETRFPWHRSVNLWKCFDDTVASRWCVRNVDKIVLLLDTIRHILLWLQRSPSRTIEFFVFEVFGNFPSFSYTQTLCQSLSKIVSAFWTANQYPIGSTSFVRRLPKILPTWNRHMVICFNFQIEKIVSTASSTGTSTLAPANKSKYNNVI